RTQAALLAVMDRPGHHTWTLDELGGELAAAGAAADFSTLFRAVERLVAEGRLRKLKLDESAARYERNGAHHDHLRCTLCNALVPVPCLAHQIDFAALERATGFTIAHHDIVLDGICPACRAHPSLSESAS
ncbi:MAG TPA: transcriptional repressor, partial [Acidiphilium sp.]